MNIEQERAAFEAWCASREYDFMQRLDGTGYNNMKTYRAWEAWQARAALAAQAQEAAPAAPGEPSGWHRIEEDAEVDVPLDTDLLPDSVRDDIEAKIIDQLGGRMSTKHTTGRTQWLKLRCDASLQSPTAYGSNAYRVEPPPAPEGKTRCPVCWKPVKLMQRSGFGGRRIPTHNYDHEMALQKEAAIESARLAAQQKGGA